MAGSLVLTSWPTTTGFDGASYFDHFLEQFQFGMPSSPGILPSRAEDILGAYTDELKVIGDSTGMQVKVSQGRATAKGVFAKLQDAAVAGGVYTLDVTAAHATLQRVDRVIIEFDLTTGAATLKMSNGTTAATGSAVPPALTQDATTWQLGLAIVMVDPAVVTIAPVDVIDTRWFTHTLDSLARAVAAPNPIIDGGMTLWPDGATFTGIASGIYGPAMFFQSKSGSTAVYDLLQSDDVPAVAEAVGKELYSLHIDVTTADAAAAAGDIGYVLTRVEGRRARYYLQRDFTLFFWVKDSVIGPHAVSFRNSGSDRYFVGQYFVEAADTWQLVAIHVTASPAAGTWDYDTGAGLTIGWTLIVGTTRQADPGVWGTGNFLGTSRTVNSLSSIANNFRLTMVRATLGGVYLPFAPHPDEAMLARRYYRVFGGNLNTEGIANGAVVGTTVATMTVPLVPPMRVAPTLTVSAATDFALISSTATLIECTAVTLSGTSGPDAAIVHGTVAAGLTAGDATRLVTDSTIDARLKLNARL